MVAFFSNSCKIIANSTCRHVSTSLIFEAQFKNAFLQEKSETQSATLLEQPITLTEESLYIHTIYPFSEHKICPRIPFIDINNDGLINYLGSMNDILRQFYFTR